LGYDNKNWFFELGTAPDESSSGVRVNVMGYRAGEQRYVREEITIKQGIYFNNYSAKAGVKIFGRDSVLHNKLLRWNWYLCGGIDLLHGAKVPLETIITKDFVLNEQGDYLTYYSHIGRALRWGFLYTFGTSLRGYNKKGNNIFTMNIYYGYGAINRGRLSYHTNEIINFDGTRYYSSYSAGGEGVVISITKNIYFSQLTKKIIR
jgi:hypothetical protein